MHTSVSILAMAGFLVGPIPSTESGWQTSYSAAQKLCLDTKKPLALVIGKGDGGMKRIVRDSDWNPEIQASFASHYICVYLDADLDENRKLIKQLEIRSGVGLVLSDRKGDYQAFHHDGTLTRAELVRELKRHGQVEQPVFFSESAINSPQTPVSQIHRVEYRPVGSQSIRLSTSRGGRSSQNC